MKSLAIVNSKAALRDLEKKRNPLHMQSSVDAGRRRAYLNRLRRVIAKPRKAPSSRNMQTHSVGWMSTAKKICHAISKYQPTCQP